MSGLDPRKAAILRAIVKDYVRDGQPVGSQRLWRRHRLKVSAATIRNDMGVLEELGYIKQPHTSAGRVPTDLGYRWFIDSWPDGRWPDLAEHEMEAIDGALRHGLGALNDALEDTTHVLSDVTESTAVVVAPRAWSERLRRIDLIRRDERRATLLLIAETGLVEQTVIEFSSNKTQEQLDALVRSLNSKMAGTRFNELAAKVPTGHGLSSPDRKALTEAISRIAGRDPGDKIFRQGTAHMLSPGKFDDIETAHEVVDTLERPSLIGELLKTAKESNTVLVFVGQEIPLEQLKNCAVVFAPYEAGGDQHGALGIVGPTRMDYPHAISAVAAVAQALSRALGSEG